jgi:hypothetical protein
VDEPCPPWHEITNRLALSQPALFVPDYLV